MGAGAGHSIRKGQRGVTMEKPGLTGWSLGLYQSVGAEQGTEKRLEEYGASLKKPISASEARGT